MKSPLKEILVSLFVLLCDIFIVLMFIGVVNGGMKIWSAALWFVVPVAILVPFHMLLIDCIKSLIKKRDDKH